MRWLQESEGFITALSPPGQVPCAISHRNMVIHPEFNAASPPRNCSRHHNRQVLREMSQLSQGREWRWEKLRWFCSAQKPAWGRGGHWIIVPAWLCLYTKTTQTRYAASSKMQHFEQWWPVWRQFLQENSGDKRLPGHFGLHYKAGQKLLPFWPMRLETWCHCQEGNSQPDELKNA